MRIVLLASLISVGALACADETSSAEAQAAANPESATPTASASDAQETRPSSQASDASIQATDASISLEAATDAGMANADADATPLTGDVWVDNRGTVMGIARTISTWAGTAADVLIDASGLAWRVRATTGEITVVESRGAWYYTRTDCTGPRWFGGGLYNASTVLPRGVVYGVKSEMVGVKPSAAPVQKPRPGSVDQPVRGCEVNLHAASSGYEEADLVLDPRVPGPFEAPFHVERR